MTMVENKADDALASAPVATQTGAAVVNPSEVVVIRNLFRSEVLAERQTQWLGTVLLTPRLSHRIFAGFAALSVLGVLSFLYFGDFTRKARIDGWLVPQAGLARVFAPRTGVVTALHVKEGQEVRKGDPLLVLSDELQSAKLGATRAEAVRWLTERRDSLLQEQQETEQLLDQQRQAIVTRLATLRAEQRTIERGIELQKSRADLAARAESSQRAVRELGYISEHQLQQTEGIKLEQAARLVALERDRIVTMRERLTLEGQLQELPLRDKANIAAQQRSIAAAEQQLAEADAQREIVIPSPQTGTITAIQVEAGGRADTSVPLLTIVPAGTVLEAHLYSPSRAVGFVRPGQRVLLRYQAYPYQKFGQQDGVVVSVSRSAISPAELPSQLSGLATLSGAQEPVYRIAVRLAKQAITAQDRQLPLQPGMQLDADVALERRRLFEWVLDPLYTLTGKWNR